MGMLLIYIWLLTTNTKDEANNILNSVYYLVIVVFTIVINTYLIGLDGFMLRKTMAVVLVLFVIGSLFAFDVASADGGPANWDGTIINNMPPFEDAGPDTLGIYPGSYGSQYCRMTQLANGDWLSVYSVYDNNGYKHDPNGGVRLHVAKSTDNCRTWQEISSVAEAGRDVDNGNLIQLSNGDVLLACRSVIWWQSYKVDIYKSTNNGNSWSYLSTVDSNEGAPGTLGNPDKGVYEPHFTMLDSGDVAVVYANEKHVNKNPAYSQVISEKVSSDNGATWGSEILVAWDTNSSSSRPGMPVITKMENGHYIIVFEVGGAYGYNIYSKTSSDGVTWSSGIGDKIAHQTGAPYVLSLSDGRLAVTSNTHVLSMSNDYGATWYENSRSPWGQWADDNNLWPAIYQTGPNEIGVVTSVGRWYGGNNVQIRFGTLPASFNYTFPAGMAYGWTQYGGSWSLNNKQYTVNSNDCSKSVIRSFIPSFKDYSMEGDIKINNAGQGSLMFNVTNASAGTDSFHGYAAGIETGGIVWLGKWNGSYTELGQAPLSVNAGVSYHMTVVVNDGNIKVYINDELKIDVDDTTYNHGAVGVRGGFNNSVTFDNISVNPLKCKYTFDNNRSDGWMNYGGTWSVDDGKLDVTTSACGKSILKWTKVASQCYTLKGDVKVNQSGQGSLLFNVTDPSSGQDSFRGYGVGIDTGGVVWLAKWDNNYTQLDNESMTINSGTTYHLKIIYNNGDIKVYVNGVEKLSAADSAFKVGYVGVRGGLNSCSTTFDNIEIYAN